MTTLQRRYAPDSVEPPALVSAGFAANEVAVADAPHPLMEEYPGCSYVSNNLLFVAERRVPAVVADAADAERGMCLAVRFDLAGLPADHWNHGGYATLRLAKPIEIPAQANGIGLWVKGNASLGRLAWELTDAKGRVFISNGTPRDGAVLLNAGYENEFTHTGWRFLKMALTPKYAIPQSWFSMHWHNAEGTAMTPPFKVTALVVSSSQKLPRIDGFAPVRDQEIRLGRMAAYE